MNNVVEQILARSLLFMCCSVIIGIGIYYFANGMVVLILLAVTILILFGVYAKYHKKYIISALILILLSLVFSQLWAGRYEENHTFSDISYGEQLRFKGIISKVPDRRFDKVFLTVNPENEDYYLRIKVNKDIEFEIGDRVHIKGQLTKPESFETESGKIFDYPGYLLVSDIVGEVRFAQVEYLEYSGKHSIVRALARLNSHMQQRLKQVLYYESLPLALGTTLGSQEYFDNDLSETFRKSGLSHIVVLSGFNISIIAIILRGVFVRIRIPRHIQLVAVIVGIWSFVAIVGFSPSIIRAASMASIAIVALMVGREASALRALVYASTVMIILNPRILTHDIGFQLSLSATLGMVVLLPYISNILYPESKPSLLPEIIISTLCASIATLPVMLMSLGSLSGMSLLSNIAVVWLVPYLMLVVALMLVAGSLPVIGYLGSSLVLLGTQYITWVATFIAYNTPSTIQANSLLLLACIAGVAFVFSIIISRRRGRLS